MLKVELDPSLEKFSRKKSFFFGIYFFWEFIFFCIVSYFFSTIRSTTLVIPRWRQRDTKKIERSNMSKSFATIKNFYLEVFEFYYFILHCKRPHWWHSQGVQIW